MSNAELIERLNKPCGRTTGHGESCSVGWLCGACADKAKAADALELADKRIAELESAIVAWKADQKENMAVAFAECERANKAERKLSVAREALKQIPHALGHDFYAAATTIADEALAQIGGEDASS